MKKLLAILAAVGLTATSTTNIMACTPPTPTPVVRVPDSETPTSVLGKIQASDDFKNSSTIDFTFKSTNKRGLS